MGQAPGKTLDAASGIGALSDELRVRLARGYQSMTLSEVKRGLQAGRKWVLWRGLVVDVTTFIRSHPGGAWVIEHNIGDDISMWFAGQGTGDDNGAQSHAHSARAKSLLLSMVIGAVRLSSDDDDDGWIKAPGASLCSWWAACCCAFRDRCFFPSPGVPVFLPRPASPVTPPSSLCRPQDACEPLRGVQQRAHARGEADVFGHVVSGCARARWARQAPRTARAVARLVVRSLPARVRPAFRGGARAGPGVLGEPASGGGGRRHAAISAPGLR
jgi:hypothetical protein